MNTELIIVGGFLGAGKTTSILSVAKNLIKLGKRVGIVTNDQGSDLVDTNYLRKAGLSVLEVAGGCFCCNFEEFVSKIHSLSEKEMPDVILAEPVGSCTDLIATIFKPMQLKYMSKVVLRPLSIVADPQRVKKLMMQENLGFHSEINYLFQKQLEEADIIVLNKIDCIRENDRKDLIGFIKNKYKNADVLSVSAKNNINIDEWISTIYNVNTTKAPTLDIDYNLYGDAEAKLGWLNLTARIEGKKDLCINEIIEQIMLRLKDEFIKNSLEIAHLKFYGVSEDDWSKASITTIHEELDFSRKADKTSKLWNIIMNARIDSEPEVLQTIVESVLDNVLKAEAMETTDLKIQCFKPSRPNPSYRIE